MNKEEFLESKGDFLEQEFNLAPTQHAVLMDALYEVYEKANDDFMVIVDNFEKEIFCLIGQVGFQTDDKRGHDFPYPEIKAKVRELKKFLKSKNEVK